MNYEEPLFIFCFTSFNDENDNSIDLQIKSNGEIREAIALLLPAIQAAREAARAHNTLMKIVLASNVFDKSYLRTCLNFNNNNGRQHF